MKQMSSEKQKKLLIESQNHIEKLDGFLKSKDILLKRALRGWDNTLKEWKYWTHIWVIMSLFCLVSGIFSGILIGMEM